MSLVSLKNLFRLMMVVGAGGILSLVLFKIRIEFTFDHNPVLSIFNRQIEISTL
jgi:hypothetical protein